MQQKRILEIACFNAESAFKAEKAGADRLELCENYAIGGITPSREMISHCKQQIKIPLYVIIRPRGGNFYYSFEEIDQMKKDILFCKEQNINGVVLGCLTAENKIDEQTCRELLELSRPMSVTFHRAIDACESILEEVEKLVFIGFDRVLTSGGKTNALEGKEMLKQLQEKFNDKVIVLPGGGVRSTNISEIIKETKCSEYHSAALLKESDFCDEEEIRNLKRILNSF